MLSIFLFFLVFSSTSGFPRQVVKTLTVHNGGVWGDWHPPQFCAAGYFANGYTMKIEERQGNGDDSSVNSIVLRCTRPRNYGVYGGQISSGQGTWGDWTGWNYCRDRDFITSFALQVEPDQGNGDDSAVNFIKFKCRNLPAGEDEYAMYLPPGTGYWGSYGHWSESCPINTAVCGIQTRIEKVQGGGLPFINDDSALNDVKLFCCTAGTSGTESTTFPFYNYN